ncbi:VOC family protein [Nocardia iowensis]|uniref:VOC family protein n=1 Tax=Nocardia iowensis TaxID=204891 RepID=A0ABX8RJ78_NOCIO|nr:VOC family protein [Nocardia iowensis]QXN89037.1 VOC family protein [Nocardia iowensis]
MKAHVNAITLAVSDLERSFRFYSDGLGLSSPGIIGTEHVGDRDTPGGAAAMFTLDNGLVLALYSRTDLAKDAALPLDRIAGSPVSLGYFVDTREDVDRILAQAHQAGATIVRPPLERPWGIYSGYFTDPDGHLWEAVYFLDGQRPN